MNQDHRNGTHPTDTSSLPQPSRNGANGDAHRSTAPANVPGGAAETGVCEPLPSANGANGQAGRSEDGDAPSPSANGANGRDGRGRFAKGNPGGPGNPFARRTAQLRRVLSMAISEEDIEAVAKRLLEQAKAGDVAAARLLLSYAIGQPTAAVDPDTLDRQEWEVFQQIPVPAPEVARLLRDVPVDFACKMARALAPHLGDIAAKKARAVFAGTSKSTKKQRKLAKRGNACMLARPSRLDLFFPPP